MPLRFCFGPDEDTSNLRAGMSAYLSIDTGRVRTLKSVLSDLADFAADVAHRPRRRRGRRRRNESAAVRDHRAERCDGC